MASEPYSTMTGINGVNVTNTPNIYSKEAAMDRAREQSRATGKYVSVHDSSGREIANFHDGRQSNSRRSSL